MKISLFTMAIHSFVPMLESMSGWLDKAAAHAEAQQLALVDARLAPDMYTLAQQVMLACHHARNAAERLTGCSPTPMDEVEQTLVGLKAQITRTVAYLRATQSASFEGAEERDCAMPIPNGMTLAFDGLSFLHAWALPHFYFHVVTAYGILRHSGVSLGKPDYLSQVGPYLKRR